MEATAWRKHSYTMSEMKLFNNRSYVTAHSADCLRTLISQMRIIYKKRCILFKRKGLCTPSLERVQKWYRTHGIQPEQYMTHEELCDEAIHLSWFFNQRDSHIIDTEWYDEKT